ncbi:MAG: RNA polymerase sigma factor, partial [Saprospiraceae bacterium]|nr:RNA polymerase sigma factor [Saprospiraceae bacterium]
IVVNQCINALKRRKVSWVELSNLAIPDATQDPLPDKLEVEKVRYAIARLPVGYRTVFSLYLLEGYDHKEISEILGISEGASKSQYSRAKAKIRTLLTDKSDVC